MYMGEEEKFKKAGYLFRTGYDYMRLVKKEKKPSSEIITTGRGPIEPFFMTPREDPGEGNRSQNQGTSFFRSIVLLCTVL